MGTPDQPHGFVRLQADDLIIYVSHDIWDQIRPGQAKLLIGVSGYGRFWLHITPLAGIDRAHG